MKRLIMKYKILFISLIALLMAISAVSASENDTLIVDEGTYHSFSELDEIINNDSVSEITLENNYKYDDHSIMLERNNSCSINGNGHVIDGITDSEFSISCGSNAVTINNLTFQNCNNSTFAIGSPVVFNNVKFINCSDVSKISFFSLSDNVKFNNCVFEMKEGNYNIIAVSSNNLSVNNTVFNGKGLISSVIKGDHNVRILVENTVIANFTAPFAAAINTKGDVLTVRKSKFLNLHADSSAGAILGKFYALKSDEGELLTPDPFVIEDCEFTNVTSNVDAGAIYFDLDSCAEGVTHILMSSIAVSLIVHQDSVEPLHLLEAASTLPIQHSRTIQLHFPVEQYTHHGQVSTYPTQISPTTTQKFMVLHCILTKAN